MPFRGELFPFPANIEKVTLKYNHCVAISFFGAGRSRYNMDHLKHMIIMLRSNYNCVIYVIG